MARELLCSVAGVPLYLEFSPARDPRDGLVADVVGQARGRKFFLLRTLAADREDGAEQVKRWLKETPHAKIEGQVRLMGVAR